MRVTRIGDNRPLFFYPTCSMPGWRARGLVVAVPVGLCVALVVADDPESPARPGWAHSRTLGPVHQTGCHPQVAEVGGWRGPVLEHLHDDLVDLQCRSAAQLVEQRLHQRLAGTGRCDHLVQHRASRQLHPKARELPVLPIQRQRVAGLRRGDERQQLL